MTHIGIIIIGIIIIGLFYVPRVVGPALGLAVIAAALILAFVFWGPLPDQQTSCADHYRIGCVPVASPR